MLRLVIENAITNLLFPRSILSSLPLCCFSNLLKVLLMIMCRRIGQETNRENLLAEIGDRKAVTHERDGRIKSLLKKTYLSRWVGPPNFRGIEAEGGLNIEGNRRSNSSMEFARLVNIFRVNLNWMIHHYRCLVLAYASLLISLTDIRRYDIKIPFYTSCFVSSQNENWNCNT